MRADRRGAALILVVVVIAALLAIGAPFVASMRLHERSGRAYEAQTHARLRAESGRNHAMALLRETHPHSERLGQGGQGADVDGESVDTLDELEVFWDDVSGLQSYASRSAGGSVVEVEVTDERAKLDLNTCGAGPIANLLGATVTTARLTIEEEEELLVADTSDFYSDGDPATIDGFVRVGNEYIAYRHLRPDAFLYLERGFMFSGTPPPEDPDRERFWPAGSLVQDGRAYKVALHPIWANLGTADEGQLARFETVNAIRKIADWEFATLRAALQLYRYGVSFDQLRRWGVTDREVTRAGFYPSDFGGELEEGELTAEEAREQRDAERALERWGLDADLLMRFGGRRGAVRIYRILEAMDGDRRDQTIELYRQRQDAASQRASRIDDWLESESRKQFALMAETRDLNGNLETIGRIEFEAKLRPFLTVHAPTEGARWSHEVLVTHEVEFDPNDWATRIRIPVRQARRFITGQIVRIQPQAGGPPEFRYLIGRNIRNNGRAALVLFPQVDRDYLSDTVTVSCRQPSPLNVNTAPREVLIAAITGLQSRVSQSTNADGAANFVTPEEAARIADAIVESPPRSHHALGGLLLQLASTGQIEAHDAQAVIRNAVDPADPLLASSTVPFCYATGDVYTIDAAGVVLDDQGMQVARHRFEEVVRIAPPEDLVWSLDSQWDFTQSLSIPGPSRGQPDPPTLHQLYRPDRWTHLVETGPIRLGPYEPIPLAEPSRSHGAGSGVVQPLRAREPDVPQGSNAPISAGGNGISAGPQAGLLRMERWDDDPQGTHLGVGLTDVTLPAAQLGRRYYVREDLRIRSVLGPTLIRGWFRFDGGTQGPQAFVFDGGEADAINRFSLYVENGELVLSVKDETLDQRETGGNPRATELRYTPNPPLQDGQWYHIAAFVKGGDRGDLALAVDGRFGGQETLGSRLVGTLDPFSTSIQVEDASRFPDAGWVRVGSDRIANALGGVDRGLWGSGRDSSGRCEVLYYSRKSGNALIVESFDVGVTQFVQSQGGTIDSVIDTSSNQDLGGLPGNARLPQRGSGRTYLVRYTLPGPPPQQQAVRVGLGFSHEAGTEVVPFGYASQVRADPFGAQEGIVRLGGARLRDPILQGQPYTLLYEAVPNYDPLVDPVPQIVDVADTELPVLWVGTYPDAAVGPEPNDPNNPNLRNLVGGFPPRGILKLGDERIYYDGVDIVGGRFLNCRRGVLGTTAAAHSLFDPLVLESVGVTYPAGYGANPNDHYPQRAAITDPRVYVQLFDGTLLEWVAPVLAAPGQDVDLLGLGLMLLPVEGGVPPHPLTYILLNEMVNNNGDLGAQPGLQPITDPFDPAHPESGVLWKEALKRAGVSGTARAQKGTALPQRPPTEPAWAPGTPLYSTVVVRRQDAFESGAGDVVTVADEAGLAPPREEMEITHAAETQRGDADEGWLIAFREDPQRVYRGSAQARIAKWPTGNIDADVDLVFGNSRPATDPSDSPDRVQGMVGRIDDLVVMQLSEPPTRSSQLDTQQTTLLGQPGNPQAYAQGRLYVREGEVYAVVNASPSGNGADLQLLRGALGSTPTTHSPETAPWELPWPPVAVAGGGLGGRRGSQIPIRGGQGFRRITEFGGYAAVDPGGGQPFLGLWPYTNCAPNSHLERPIDRAERGCFPGAFGTSPPVPSADMLLVDLPFRVHDRYAPSTDSLEGVFVQATRELPGSLLMEVDWDATTPPGTVVHVAVRVDGAPFWDATPVDEPNQPGLYLFRGDERRALGGRRRELFRRAHRVEVRAYLTFVNGAYYSGQWKQGAQLGGLRLTYRQPTQVLRHEARVD